MAEKKPTEIGSKEWQMEHVVVDLNSMSEDIKKMRGDLHFIFIWYLISFIVILIALYFLFTRV